MHINKLIKYLPLSVLLFSGVAQAGIGEYTITEPRNITEIVVETGAGKAFYYFRAEQNDWIAYDCPGVQQAFMDADAPGAKAILSLALTAKTTNTKVKFRGTCGDFGGNPGYLVITHVYM